jgi:hypothetical protein
MWCEEPEILGKRRPPLHPQKVLQDELRRKTMVGPKMVKGAKTRSRARPASLRKSLEATS